MISPFVLHQPHSLSEALSTLSEHNGDANILAGGSELLLLLKMNLLSTKHVVDIKKIPGLSRLDIDPKSQVLHVGPLVTHRTLELSQLIQRDFPLIAEMERDLANVRIRNVGTLAGNLCFAEPHADPAALLAAYDAVVTLSNSERERRVDIQDFYTDYYETALLKDEILIDIEIPKTADSFSGTYQRFCPGEWPIVTVALLTNWNGEICDEARLGVGCVGPKPLRVTEFEEMLHGKTAEEITAKSEEFAAIAAKICEPLPDLWGSTDYKKRIVKNLIKAGLQKQCRRERKA